MSLRDEYFPDETPTTPPRTDLQPIQVQNRGTTSQIHQALLWSKHTIHKNTVAAKLRRVARTSEAVTLENCHTIFTIAVCTKCGVVQKFPNRCDLYFCPECQPRISADRKKAVAWWTREISQPKHMVLTVQNTPHLDKGCVKEFRKWFCKLRRRKFAANWLGGFYTLEVTNEGNGWHLHLHALIDAKWIDEGQLSTQWQEVTNGLGRIVKVRDARGKNYLAEVTKYCVKGVQLAAWNPEQITTFIDAFAGIRTFGVFGTLYGARTKFRLWWKAIRNEKPRCKCGSCEARYFTESQFLEMDLVATRNADPIPPPVHQDNLTIPLNFNEFAGKLA